MLPVVCISMGGTTENQHVMKQFENGWLDEYREGRTEVLAELVEEFRRPLFGFIIRMTEGRDDAEEIFQEVWFRAIRKLDSFQPRKSLLSWLFRIAHNLVIDRARKRKPTLSLQHNAYEDGLSLEEKLETPALDPAEVVGGHDLGVHIAAAVSRLPLEQKEVFVMRTEGQLPFKEIATIQGTSINTALARMQYAVAKLKDELRDDYEELTQE